MNYMNDPDKPKIANPLWTGVLSTDLFRFSGCLELNVEEDVEQAWQEINMMKLDGKPVWQFIFNAKDHELPNAEQDLNKYRLSADELHGLGIHVARLRLLAS